ncbi:MAG TPA: class I tRNA ligase family protein [Candidatus Paceibacterota bacterium]|nr:class I tRNA ligase family protein [Candidatus Paceibacterota bacterium]
MPKYDFGKIEKKWQKYWRENRIYEPDFNNSKNPFYNLMMFPYPSAEGLHVGNMYAFTGADIYGRMKRMQGYDVFQPIGLDGFGIHSENYALKIKAHPMEQAKVSEKRFYKQLEMIGNGFAWEEKLETYDPEYYKWTQWIFVQMFKRGLAYRAKAPVNWCSSCKTVLADEQVVAGRCERCGSFVEKRELEQWFFRITKYAEKLLKNLEKIDWSERVKIAQKNWIGKSEGALIKFPIPNSQISIKEIEVFTTRPDTLYGATFIVISPELAKSWMGNDWRAPGEVKKYVAKALENRSEEQKEKTGVFTGIYAINPATKEEIPVWVADYVLAGYGTGAIMAVPAHDERDMEFAKKFGLPVSNAPLEDKDKIIQKVGGRKKTQYRLRDWLISRQRYWGPPIPLVFCETCKKRAEISSSKFIVSKQQRKDFNRGELENPGWVAVPEENLPVELPFVKNFQPKGKGESPLASDKSFYETKCPKCGGKARRETDVSDTFLDSAWYYIRYPSVNAKQDSLETRNSKLEIPWNRKITRRWLPVDLYTGGAEHSVLHLLYVRFIALALHDEGLLDFGPSDAPKGEPFPKFRAHGLLIKEGAKMSKSKGNVVNPDEYIKRFGADTLRMYLMFLAPFEYGGDFRDAGILGISRFLERVWKLFSNKRQETKNIDKGLERKIHQTIKKVTEDIESLHYNTAISALMILLNEMEKQKSTSRASLTVFLKLLAPFAPHIAEELWEKFGNKSSIHKEKWPDYDSKLINEETIDLVIQVNGKHRATISVSRGLSEKEAVKLVLGDKKVKEALGKAKIRKTVFVKNRLINFVTDLT